MDGGFFEIPEAGEIDNLASMQYKMMKEWIKTYDKIFLLDPLPLVADEKRSCDKDLQCRIDVIMKTLIKRLEIPVISIETNDLEERYGIFIKEMERI